MPVEALKKTIGAPDGAGDSSATRWAARNFEIVEPADESALETLGINLTQGSHHQSLSFSYPSCTSKSPATSLNNFLCSSVKYSRQPPVFPERKV